MGQYDISPSFISVDKEVHEKWFLLLKEHKMVYLSGSYGFGRTEQAIYFAREYFKNMIYLDTNQSDFTQLLETIDITKDTLLIIDNLQALKQQDKIINILQKHQDIFIMLLSNATLPDFLIPLRIAKRLVVLDSNSLVIGYHQVLDMLEKQEELQGLKKKQINDIAKDCVEFTNGRALFIQIYLVHVCESQDLQRVHLLAKQDFFYHMDIEFDKWPLLLKESLTKLGIFSDFHYDIAKLILGSDVEVVLSSVMERESFLSFEVPDLFRFDPLVFQYFHHRLNLLEEKSKQRVYEIAANHYEEERLFEQALYCYKKSNNIDKIIEIVIYLLENADGCSFAQISDQYINLLTEKHEKENPSVIGAKAMFYAYRMQPEQSQYYLQKLKEQATKITTPTGFEAIISVYVRTLMASPCVSAKQLRENLTYCYGYIQKFGFELKNIMPTGNFASIMNGGIDLVTWIPYYKALFPVFKPIILKSIGKEAIGVPEAVLGELFYEQNKSSLAMVELTHALSDANLKGSIRMQYAITGIMARLLQSEGQLSTSRDILENIYDKALQKNYNELLANIRCSIIQCDLLEGNQEVLETWLYEQAINEYDTFYITSRYRLLTKAKVYISCNRNLEALHIIEYLERYASMYYRNYLSFELGILKAIILYRRKEEYEEVLIKTIEQTKKYKLNRVVSDQGIALLPLWKRIDWSKYPSISKKYIQEVTNNLEKMANYYPHYLEVPQSFGNLTERELVVLRLLSKGQNNTQISKTINVSLGTTKFHVSNIIKKLNAKNRTEVVEVAKENELI